MKSTRMWAPVSALGMGLATLISTLALTGCQPFDSGSALGSDGMHHGITALTNYNEALGSGCQTGNPGHICLAVKVVAYLNSKGQPTVSQAEATQNLQPINDIWSQCNISFQMDQYLPVTPSAYGLRYRTANLSELDPIRKTFQDGQRFLVVTTGTWDRTGTLGNTGANAWTEEPPYDPFGVILEAPVATFGNIIAHELGHYLNLNHVDEANDVMSPIIYTTSQILHDEQCHQARMAAHAYWTGMFR